MEVKEKLVAAPDGDRLSYDNLKLRGVGFSSLRFSF
jgi:hypothetical protein